MTAEELVSQLRAAIAADDLDRMRALSLQLLRPYHHYQLTFVHPLSASLVHETDGETPCAAKGYGWQWLEAYLRDHPDLPGQDWALARAEDLGRTVGMEDL